MDRLITVTDAASNITTYGYDTENNLTGIKDANNHTTTFTYDAFGRVTKTSFPSTLAETYGYDANNNLTSKIDRKNQQTTYTYDQLNRLTQKAYPDSTSVHPSWSKMLGWPTLAGLLLARVGHSSLSSLPLCVFSLRTWGRERGERGDRRDVFCYLVTRTQPRQFPPALDFLPFNE